MGDIVTSNDYGSTIIGGTGNDTLIAGHGADTLTGGGGDNFFVFQALPWNAGQITDFAIGSDKLDLSAILNAVGYTGSDPVTDGYVTFQSDGSGDTQVYVNSHDSSEPWPTLVTTLDGISPIGLTSANTLGIAGSTSSSNEDQDSSGSDSASTTTVSSTSVQTSAVDYVVPSGVTTVQLTGTAAQTVHANNTGDTITSNDYGSTIVGGTGNDTLIAGHGADTLTGGGGNDTFMFNNLPWNAGHITDFDTATDILDLSGIFKSISYTGTNPVSDGYLNFASDGMGGTKVYVDPQGHNTTTPILVTALDHVSPGSLHQGDWIYA
jgi:Ca2+-binding RTX toxin-like protein